MRSSDSAKPSESFQFDPTLMATVRFKTDLAFPFGVFAFASIHKTVHGGITPLVCDKIVQTPTDVWLTLSKGAHRPEIIIVSRREVMFSVPLQASDLKQD